MLNVPSSSFPVPSSQQRVSAGGRSKTPLKPGRSLMDWIRVKSSGKDLTGLRGRLIEVTEEELAKHNKKDDCWTCIRGLVYNVTPYMEFHPGGEEELMKAAGADGTQLFDQVHRWVNYESMLKECFIGRMAVKHVSSLKGGKSAETTVKEVLNGHCSMLPPETDKPSQPRYDWFQTDSTLTVVIYTKEKNLSSAHVTVDIQENILREEVTIGDYSYLLLIELNYTIQNFKVTVSGRTGNIEVIMQKKDPNTWKNLGHPLEGHNTLVKISQREIYYRKCRLSTHTDVNHDTRLFCFELPQSCHLQVPVGHHVYLKLTISDTEVVKPYTPVLQALVTDLQPSRPDGQYIYMMIKIYPNGSFTPHIDKLAIGDYVYISNPRGCFRMAQLEGKEDILLVAAGTGFTPMVKLLGHVLDNSIPRKIKLIFFNKTEDDILWKDQLENLCINDKRFEVRFILSEPSDSWTGHKGQISTPLLSEAGVRSDRNSKVQIFICGPVAFIDKGIRSLEDLGFSQEEIFVFRE